MAKPDLPLYPLKFEPIYKEKVWGGQRLTELGHNLPGGSERLIGESWVLADLASGSPSGGGVTTQHSVVSNGPLQGTTLHDLLDQYGQKLLGHLNRNAAGDFPLLVKFLDARDNLSVQVHPSPTYVRAHPQTHLKSEAWYIIAADPGAILFKGIKPDVTPDEFRGAIESGTASSVERLLIKVPAKAGDCHYLPSGTCHALGAGILVAEVQTPSDTTFRVFDWNRSGRDLHVEPAMECIDFSPPSVRHEEKRSHIAGMFTTVSRLITCDHFRIEKVRMVQSYEQELPYDQPAVWIVLEGSGRIHPDNGAESVVFQRGQTLLIPAALSNARVVIEQDAVWLEVTFPQAWPEQIA